MKTSITKIISISIVFSIAVFLSVGTIARADERGDELITEFRAAADAVESFTASCNRSDLGDEFVLARNKIAMESYEPILSKLEMLTRKSMMPEEKEIYKSMSEISFYKPFGLQVEMIGNDFLPPLMNGSVAYFRPDINEDEIFLREPILKIPFRRPMENDTANILIINWTYDQLEIDCALANGGEVKYAGTEEYEDIKADVVEISLKKGETPWATGCAGETYGLPETAHQQFTMELSMMADRIEKYGEKDAVLRLWIDPETKLIVRKQVRFADREAIEQTCKKIELNNVDKKKLNKPKKSKQ